MQLLRPFFQTELVIQQATLTRNWHSVQFENLYFEVNMYVTQKQVIEGRVAVTDTIHQITINNKTLYNQRDFEAFILRWKSCILLLWIYTFYVILQKLVSLCKCTCHCYIVCPADFTVYSTKLLLVIWRCKSWADVVKGFRNSSMYVHCYILLKYNSCRLHYYSESFNSLIYQYQHQPQNFRRLHMFLKINTK